MADIHSLGNATEGGGEIDGGGGEGGLQETIVRRRLRRPTVRLDKVVSDETHLRRTSKNESKSFKTRALLNSNEINEDSNGKDAMLNSVIGTWRVKDSKKGCFKRLRSNRGSMIDAGKKDGAGRGDDGNKYRDFDRENLGNPEEQLSLGMDIDIDIDNLSGRDEKGVKHKRRVSGGYNGNGVEFSARSKGMELSADGDDGVTIWLNGLGLGRYAPIFEIHEVDTLILPLLTLEDLKDMGITAVGSRRKMFCAIQKLGKGFS